MATFIGELNNTTLEPIDGTSEDDDIWPGGGWDVVDGGDGVDTVYVEGKSRLFTLVAEDGVVYVDSLSAASAYADRVQLINIERVQFWDDLVDLRVSRVFRDDNASGFVAGGPGYDTMVYSGPRDNFLIEKVSAYTFVQTKPSLDMVADYRFDRLESIETVQFADQAVTFALNTDSFAGQASRLISVVLGPQFLNDSALAGIVVHALEQGSSLEELAALGASTGLFLELAGGPSNTDFVQLLYQNLMGFAASETQVQALVYLVDSGSFTKGSLAVAAVSLTETMGQIDFTGLASQGWAYDLLV